MPDAVNRPEDSAAYVARLLAGVADAPNFPFDDWQSQPESFSAITAFW